ncbi:hypothetical protein [Massilia sp. TWR1-2-2]|uniref:hypothetical protein n=1 Tax=Massilia sp. TWR1-2-2 TaxID=2804584 RepID=UPI003CEFA1FD
MALNSGTDEADLANGDWAAYILKMDRRLIVLETRFDTILPTLATKADLIELKAAVRADIVALRMEVYAFKAEIQRWMTATLLTMLLGFAGMIVTMLKLLPPG